MPFFGHVAEREDGEGAMQRTIWDQDAGDAGASDLRNRLGQSQPAISVRMFYRAR